MIMNYTEQKQNMMKISFIINICLRNILKFTQYLIIIFY